MLVFDEAMAFGFIMNKKKCGMDVFSSKPTLNCSEGGQCLIDKQLS
jgi:hypothetical protein